MSMLKFLLRLCVGFTSDRKARQVYATYETECLGYYGLGSEPLFPPWAHSHESHSGTAADELVSLLESLPSLGRSSDNKVHKAGGHMGAGGAMPERGLKHFGPK